jgi:hypothetical protein
MKYGGVVGPLFSSLRRGSGPKPDRLLGQEVKTTRGDIRAFVALDAGQNAHLVINPAPVSDERFRRFRLRTFRIEIRDWVVADQKVQKYLDICCVTGGDETLLRPFVAFCDDLLIDLDDGISSPEAAAFRTARRWYSFWTRESTELSQQAMRGLLGELSFLEFLIRENGSKALTAWTGPEGQDHDFQAGHEIAFEVKTSSSIPYNVECNLNQLDRGLFAKLFLVCFKVEKSAGGVSLPELVGRIDGLLRDDDAALETFGEKLALAGYSRQRETEYGLHRFAVSPAEVFLVTDGFPTITLKSFVRPPDMRVLDVRYVLEISGLPSLPLHASALSADLRRLCEPSA